MSSSTSFSLRGEMALEPKYILSGAGVELRTISSMSCRMFTPPVINRSGGSARTGGGDSRGSTGVAAALSWLCVFEGGVGLDVLEHRSRSR